MGTPVVKCEKPEQTKGDCCLQYEEVPCWHLNIQNVPGGGFSSEAVLQIECRLWGEGVSGRPNFTLLSLDVFLVWTAGRRGCQVPSSLECEY